jgi:hypothetical protein
MSITTKKREMSKSSALNDQTHNVSRLAFIWDEDERGTRKQHEGSVSANSTTKMLH